GNNNFDLCPDVSCSNQYVGNNSLLCIAIAKFVLYYPDHGNTPDYLIMLRTLMFNMNDLEEYCGNDLIGYGGRVEMRPRYISTEHMIDLCGLCQITELLLLDDEPFQSMIA